MIECPAKRIAELEKERNEWKRRAVLLASGIELLQDHFEKRLIVTDVGNIMKKLCKEVENA